MHAIQKKNWRWMGRTALLAALCSTVSAVAEDKPPALAPKEVSVVVAPGDNYKVRTKSNFSKANTPQGEQDLVLTGNASDPIELKFEAHVQSKTNLELALHIEGVVKDFFGTEVPDGKIAWDVTLKNNEKKAEVRTVKPASTQVGPFVFTGSWSDKKSDRKGELSIVIPQANSHSRVDDFEAAKFKAEKTDLEYSISAQYMTGSQGRNGLVVHLPKPADAKSLAKRALPYDVKLPGRPVKLGFWMKAAGNVQVSALLSNTKEESEKWFVGPLALQQADWRYVELPIYPGTPASGDYRLTLKELIFEGPADVAILIDDLDVHSQRDLTASVSCGEASIPFWYDGSKIHPNGQFEEIHNRPGQAQIFGDVNKPTELKVSASAFGKDRTVHLNATITDFHGVQQPNISVDIPVQAGQPIEKAIPVTFTEKSEGPFYVTGNWTELNTNNSDAVNDVFGRANWHLILDDFERIRHPEAGAALENSPLAKHRGETGLIVRPTVPQYAPGTGPANDYMLQLMTAWSTKTSSAAGRVDIPFGTVLTGRPVKIGMWLKSAAAIQVCMRLHDPGVNHMGAMRYDSWMVGPVEAAAGDWRYIELPMPGFCEPESRHKSFCETNGVIDYPLTLDNISIIGAPQTEVMIDDVDLWSSSEQSGSTIVNAYSAKPASLLYKNDVLNICVENAWLSGKPLDVTYKAKFIDINGRDWPLADGTASVPSGTEFIERAKINDLPVGSYSLVAEVRSGDKIIATIPPAKTAENPFPEQTFIVYEPSGRTLPSSDLQKLLHDRERLITELGFEADTCKFSWDSSQDLPSVENFPGYFYFDWMAPDVKKRRDAGLEVMGVLGLTPQFYAPGADYKTIYSSWFGDSTIMPSRSLYFEEYAHRTIENFTGQVNTWIVWDQIDKPDFATPADYTDNMLEVARRAANETNPNAKLITGSVKRDKILPWLEGIIESGGHSFVDGFGILPSPAPNSPEDGNMDVILARAQRLRQKEFVKPELWVLNLGWNTGITDGTVTESDQATYIPRAWVICQAQGINHIFVTPDGTQPIAQRNSADLIYPSDGVFGIKPAAITTKVVRSLMKGASVVREVFLNDHWEGLSRAYLFKRLDGKLLLAAWRRDGTSVLPLSVKPESVVDAFGNPVPVTDNMQLTLRKSPQYAIFSNVDSVALIKQLERSVIGYEDAPESAWKSQFTFHLDVGDPEEEKAAQYKATDSHIVGPIDSYYFSEYGRHVIDSGRHIKGEEGFVVDVSKFGGADLMLRKRINYSIRDQLVKVYCNEQYIGNWCAPLADRRFRWRDIEFIIPNSAFSGKDTASLRFVTPPDAQATSYYYWAGPLRTKKVYVSDLSFLCGTAGPAAPMVSRDKNIIGAPMLLAKNPVPFSKGIGTNTGEKQEESLLVLCLNKQYKTLHFVAGIDACTNGRGAARFFIQGYKKKLLFDSNHMNAYSEPVTRDIDVSDQFAILLWVSSDGQSREQGIANWADLRLELK